MSKGARRLVTLPNDIDERAMKFCNDVSLSISSGLAMLIAAALDSVDGVEPSQFCGCDHAKTCAAIFNKEYIGRCRRQQGRKEA